ncbi:hypothetical protein AB1K89_03340 [Sporosarcina sp. 179-K 8C2 HS]|uniref:hypothetical protein n=1 Tax=Sporosarcina sp. 179-K 8C2 HS TaxID=3142387 RepID=UPI0039A09147
MKFNWKIVCTGFAAAILLTACGTDNAEQKEGANPDNAEQVVDETNGSVTDGTSTDSDSKSGSESEGVEEPTDKMAGAVLTESDEQSYAIEVLPGYTLTSEEPGRDSLYAEENSNAFMRIETQPAEDGSYEYLLENMQEVLKAASNGGEPEELTDVYSDVADKGIDNVKAFKVDTETGPVTGVVFEKDGMVVRLTLFDTPEENYKEDFLNMGQTIQ